MDRLIRLAVGVVTTLGVIVFQGGEVATPAPPTSILFASVLEAPIASHTPSTTIPATPPDALCPQWWPLARQVGWAETDLPTLDYVLWKESRCDPTVHNTTLNTDGSTDIGLAQVNDFSWCLPTRWYPDGYLQHIGVLTTVGCEQLFDPYHNLKAALAIHAYSTESTGNGWHPWRIRLDETHG